MRAFEEVYVCLPLLDVPFDRLDGFGIAVKIRNTI